MGLSWEDKPEVSNSHNATERNPLSYDQFMLSSTLESAMPKIIAQGKTIECESGANLRQVLLKHGIDLYNSNAKMINCRGIGSCGTCAVAIEAAVPEAATQSVSEANWRDRTRRSLPPHNPDRNLRLACQTRVFGDINVTKFDGFWGQGGQQVW